jgi:RNA polymerase sigma-70 factor (ECF subfamily)
MKITRKESFITMAVDRHGRPLLKFLVSRLPNAADAPDLVQEVYLRILRIGRPELIRCPEAYLFTIAAHMASEYTLRRSKRPIYIALDETTPLELPADIELVTTATPEHAAMNADRIRSLERVLAQLSPKARAVLVWHRRDGCTYEEIAERLGVSRNMVKKYLSQALAYCRKNIDKDSEE